MKKIALILFLISCSVYSQNLLVKYDYYYKKTDSPVTFERPSELIINPTSSLYKIFGSETQKLTREDLQTNGENYIVIRENKNKFYFKNLKEKTIFSKEKILSDDFFVKDSLNIFDWVLSNDDSKTIIGYKCNKATLLYRGRKYIAYYAIEIPVQNGPYKFHGLPGLILAITCEDETLKFTITATSIEKSNEQKVAENPYLREKIISWSDFTDIYKKKYEELKNYSESNEILLNLPKGKIEIIINE